MVFFYSDTKDTAGSYDPSLPPPNPNTIFMWHYGNYLFLNLVIRNDTDFINRRQADKELLICLRKMEYWERKHGYNHTENLQKMIDAKKLWRMEDLPDRPAPKK